MSLTSGQSVDNFNFKFLELKKYQISKEKISGFETISVDNNHQNAFVLSDTKVFVVPLNNILSFEWNKSVVNEVCLQFSHFSVDLNFKPHLVSVSAKGYGNKLAVCGTDPQSQSPFILFYDLKEVYKNQSKSSPYSRLNLINSFGFVSELVWHSELGDNQFACCLTDGSLFIVSIGDIETKSTAILSHLPSTSNSMSLCWSPKGKQIVVGHKNGYFSQYKLANGQQLQEMKKISLINEINGYDVISIKWIVPSLFVIGITKDLSQTDKDSHILLVSTPSRAVPQFVDFGSLCVDNFGSEGVYKINLFHFNNVILCGTSMSSEVAVLGCDFNKDIANLSHWCQWILDDSSRIDLPMDSEGNESYMRGMIISNGTPNVYRLSVTEAYGGVDCPLLLVYNSAGVLVPYLMIDKTGQLKGLVPPSIVKPPVVAPTPQPMPKPLTSTPIVTSITAQQNSSQKISPFASPTTSMTNSQSRAPEIRQISNPVQPPKPAVQTTQHDSNTASAQSAGDETDTRAVANELYENAIKDQIKNFNKMLTEMKNKYSKINAKIGENDERLKLKTDSRLVDEVLKELKDSFKSTSKDIATLQSSLIESFSLLEEAKSIMDRNVDPKYRSLLRQRALDPITTRRLREILSLNQYIETQLRELDAKFEQEWNEWLEKKKAIKAKQMNRIQHNTSLDLIYRAVNNNQRVINVLRHQLDRLEQMSSPLKLKSNHLMGKTPDKQIIDKLADNLNKSSLKEIPDIANDTPFKLKCISETKKNNLKDFFESRTKVPFIRPMDNSSRFISAIEKIKEKQKSIELNQSISKKVESLSAKQSPEKSKTIVKSMDNKVDITATVVNVAKPLEQITSQKKTDKTSTIAQLLQTSKPSAEPKPVPLITSQKPQSSLSTAIASPPKMSDAFKTASQKPISFSLSPTPTFPTPSQSLPFAPISSSSFAFKPQLSGDSQSSLSTLSSVTSSSTKLKSDSIKKVEIGAKDLDSLSSSSKSVSFGNTTIIETTSEDDFQLEPISELSEANESATSSETPSSSFKGFASFPGFGGNASKDSPPKLSFNLKPNTGFSFNATANAIKPNDSLPKYEDITPPSTPQKEVNKDLGIASVTSFDASKPSPILKTTLSMKTPVEQNETKPPETSILRSLISGQTKPESLSFTSAADTSAPTAPMNLSLTSPGTSTSTITSPQITPNASQISITTGTAGKTVTEGPAPSPQTISSPFTSVTALAQPSQTSQSPFATNFSFGNTLSNTNSQTPFQTTGAPGLSFGATNQLSQPSTPTTTSSGGLSFGQQTSALNSMSFCGLGGAPNPENAQKNVFGSSFSSPPLQTSPQSPAFGANTQSAPFSKTSSGGLFGGSFTSGTAGVAQTGFGAFNASPQQQSPQQTQPAFGGSPLFGGSPAAVAAPAFGGSPTFGGSPQSTGFGSAASFGGQPALGGLAGGSTFGNQSAPTFGSNTAFGNTPNAGLSFGALASNAQPSAQPQQNPFGGGFGFGGTNGDSFSFTQRRK